MNTTDLTPCPPTPSKLAARILVVVAALMWSTCGLIVRVGFPESDGWGPITGPLLAFWRALFAALFLLPLARRPRFRFHLVPMTICFTVMSISYLSAITLTTVANAIWLQATAPWWVLILSVLLLREPVVRRDLIPLCFGALGVGMILFFELRGLFDLPGLKEVHARYVGVVCGLVSGVTYGSVLLYLRQLRRENSLWLIGLNHAVVALVMLPWVIWVGIWPSWGKLGLLVVLGVVQMGIPYVCMVRGLRTISSQEAVAIALLEPVLNPLWVFLLGLETPHWWTVAGASLILVGLVLRYVVLERLRSDGAQ